MRYIIPEKRAGVDGPALLGHFGPLGAILLALPANAYYTLRPLLGCAHSGRERAPRHSSRDAES